MMQSDLHSAMEANGCSTLATDLEESEVARARLCAWQKHENLKKIVVFKTKLLMYAFTVNVKTKCMSVFIDPTVATRRFYIKP